MLRRMVVLRLQLMRLSSRRLVGFTILLFFVMAFLFLGIFVVADSIFNLEFFMSDNLPSDLEFTFVGGVVALLVSAFLFPLLETFLFQYLVFLFFIKFLRKGVPIIYMLISAIIFGFSHQAVWGASEFIIGAIWWVHKVLIGLVLACVYYLFFKKKSEAFLLTWFIHGMHNFVFTSIILFSQCISS